MKPTVDVVIPVFNAAEFISDTIRHITRQKLPEGWQVKVIASDDGSTDATPARLNELQASIPELQVVLADCNGGRSRACNAGAAAGNGSIIVICDADCRYTRDDAIAEFIREIENGADAVIGVIEMPGEGFWARYTNSVTAERVQQQHDSGLMAYSTQNIGVRRTVFDKLGGYSNDYSKYGFEDKDLLIRLERMNPRVTVRADIRVSHDDDFSLASVCRKAEESGRHSAPVFRRRFPDAYSRLAYARCDATLAGGQRYLRVLSPVLKRLTRWVAALALALPPLGFRLRRFAVRVAVCAAYFHGTRGT